MKPSPGVVLCGGGYSPETFQWMIEKSGHGDFVTIGCAPFAVERIGSLGKLKSIEHLIVDSRDIANSPEIVKKIENAEAIFIIGGNQAKYILHWKNTKMTDAINERIKYIPIGGTSAGMAVMGEYCYGSTLDDHWLTSEEALANPFHSDLDSLEKGFFHIEYLKNTITDSHYLSRKRKGRHAAFMARLIQSKMHGIGIDDCTSLCIEGNKAKVIGISNVYILEAERSPEVCIKNTPLTWDHEGKAIKVYTFGPNAEFNINEKPEHNVQYWSIVNGSLAIRN